MNDDPKESALLAEARGLIVAMIEERLQPDQARRLELLVCEREDVRRLYVIYVHLRIAIETVAQPVMGWSSSQLPESAAESMDETMVLPAMQPDQARSTPSVHPSQVWQIDAR